MPQWNQDTKSSNKRDFQEPKERECIGAGRPFEHPLKDRLLMLLVYYRLYVTSILVGYLFDLDQTNVLRDIRRLEPLVKDCVPLPKRSTKAQEEPELWKK